MRNSLIPREMLEQVAHRFKVLSETVRLEILNHLYLRDEMNVQQLVAATGTSQANISKHLRQMVDDGILVRRKAGQYAYFRIDDPSLSGLCLLVSGQLRVQAGAEG